MILRVLYGGFMRFTIFLIDSFFITIIANGIVEWKHRYNPKKGYYQMLYTSGIWVAFVYLLQFANQYFTESVKVILVFPIIVLLGFGNRILNLKKK